MDHLPTSAGKPPIEIPYLCRDMYDGGEFATFPQRRGWHLETLLFKELSLSKVPKDEATSFLQSWMYFGLLYHVFQPIPVNFDPFDFVRQDHNGRQLITTRKLPEYVLKWAGWEEQRTPEQRLERFNYMKSCFSLLQRFTIVYCHEDMSQWPLDPEICLSIIILADSLMKAGFDILNVGLGFNIDWGSSNLLVGTMKNSGWCIRAISTLLKGQQIHNLYYASTLGPPEVLRNHENCNEHVCQWEQVDEGNYEVKHQNGCGGCDFIGPPMERIIDIIQVMKPPVIRLTEQGEINVLEAEDGTPYVAISHVWSDGLGNPNFNGLPTCQIQRIQHLVDNLMSSENQKCPWWCDTLCVPVQEKYKEFRTATIRNMRNIYQNATKVLAIDSSLLRISKDAHPVELYIRLKLSTWMRRLWTLQEGILAKDTFVQFEDGAKSLREIDGEMDQYGLKDFQKFYIRHSFLARTFFGPYVRKTLVAGSQHFKNVWKTLQWRSTSRRKDETICLATILGLDPSPLLEIADEELDLRMIKLLQMAGPFPLNLLYQPPPRLSPRGFRWAPTSFLSSFRNTATNPFLVANGIAKLGPNDKGLAFNSPGLALLPSDSPFPVIGTSFTVRLLPNNDEILRFAVLYPHDEDQTATNVDGTQNLNRPAFVTTGLVNSENDAGVLVDIEEVDEATRTIKANFIARVRLIAYSRTTFVIFSGKSNFMAERLSRDQKWLIY